MANVTKVTQLTAALQPHHQLSSLEGIATCSDRISLKSEKTKKTINVMFHYQIYKYIIQKSRSNSIQLLQEVAEKYRDIILGDCIFNDSGGNID